MAKFRFSLEVLLKHREDTEQKERDTLFRIRYAYQVALRDRNVLDQKYRRTLEELALCQTKKSTPQEISWFHPYLRRLRYEIEECEKRLMQLDSDIQKQKEIVIEATKKRKIISTLKSNQEKEFALALNKKEQKEVEEWIATKHAAQRVG